MISECGKSVDPLRIMGGSMARVNSHPWIVAFVEYYEFVPYCGGSIIASDLVLTAAHCIDM